MKVKKETENIRKKIKEEGDFRFVSKRKTKSTENEESATQDVRIETPDGRSIRTLDQAFNYFVVKPNE